MINLLKDFKEGHFGSETIVRVDVPSPRDYNLRIPSGNEAGANNVYWLPGGYLPEGMREAIVDINKKTDGLIETRIDL